MAAGFELAVEHRAQAAGEDFFLTAADAFNVRGYAAAAAGWFGQEANLQTVSWEQFRSGLTDDDANTSWEHLNRSQAFSIEKAQRLLGYTPKHTVEDTTLDLVRWLVEHDRVEIVNPLIA